MRTPGSGADSAAEEPQSAFIRLKCSSCEHRFRVKSKRAGRSTRCPKCKSDVEIPGGDWASHGASARRAIPNRYAKLAKKLPTTPHTAAGRDWESKNALSARAFKKLETEIRTREPGKKETLTEANERRKVAMTKLVESRDGRAWEVLVDQLEDASSTIRTAAVSALGGIGDPRAVPALVGMFDSDSDEIRRDSVSALGKIGDRRAVRPMMLLSLDDPELKFTVAGAVTSMGEVATPELLELLNESDPGVVLESVVLLGRLRDKKAVKSLMGIIEQRSPIFRSHAAEALGQIGDERAVSVLSELLQDEDASVRVVAASALGKMPKAANAKALVRALRDTDDDVRRLAAVALGEIGDKRAGDSLTVLLDDAHADVREAAAVALGRIGDGRAIEPLLQMLDSDDEDALLRAIGAFRSLRDPAVVEQLLPFLYHERTAIRQRTVETLGLIGDSLAAERLEGVLKGDRSSDVRVAAAKALGDIRDPGSIDALEQALQDEFQIRCRAVVSLGMIGDEQSLPALLAMLKDPVPEVRFQATTAVAELGKTSAMGPLEALLEDENAMVRRGAAKALVKLGDERGDELLEIAAKPVKRKKRRKSLSSSGSLFDFSSLKRLSLNELLGIAWPNDPQRRAITVSIVLLPVLVLAGVFFFGGGPDRVVLRGKLASAAFDAEGKKLFAGRTHSGLVEVWSTSGSLEDQKPFASLGSSVNHIVVSADGTGMLMSGAKLLYMGADNQPIELGGPVSDIVSSPNQAFAATIEDGGVVRVWDLSTGQVVATVNQGGTIAVGLDDAGKTLARAHSKGVDVHDLSNPSGSALKHDIPRDKTISAVAVAPGGGSIVGGSSDGLVLAWQLGKPTPTAQVDVGSPISLVAFSGDTIYAASGAKVHEWDGVAATTTTHEAGDNVIAISGTFAATGEPEESPSVSVFDLSADKKVRTLNVKVHDPYRR